MQILRYLISLTQMHKHPPRHMALERNAGEVHAPCEGIRAPTVSLRAAKRRNVELLRRADAIALAA